MYTSYDAVSPRTEGNAIANYRLKERAMCVRCFHGCNETTVLSLILKIEKKKKKISESCIFRTLRM